MDQEPSLHLKSKNMKSTKKKKPIKVVYISNPTRITTTPSEFKGRVQELTGRHSDVSDFLEATAKPSTNALPGRLPMEETASFFAFGCEDDHDMFGRLELLGSLQPPTFSPRFWPPLDDDS